MSEKLKESLSAVIDGEADEFELRRVLDEMNRDEVLAASWERYQDLKDRLLSLGRLLGDEKPEWEDRRQFFLSAAEAMRAGCIPIVDRRGGFIEQLEPSSGFLCDSLAEFDRAIETLLVPEVRQRLSLKCEEHADRHFSLTRFRTDLLRRFAKAGSARCKSA